MAFINIKRDSRYLLIGTTTKLINIATYYIVLYFSKNLLLAIIIASSFSNSYNLHGMGRLFKNHAIFSFQTSTRFLLVLMLGSFTDFILITLLVRHFVGLNTYDAKFISIILLTPLTYLLNRFWIHSKT
jgi:putative flippase GtrA